MSKQIIINPLTRISGFMELNVTIENGSVTDVKTSGNLFRGFERMLRGRNPFDAVYFTERICGICSTAHSIASSMALEEALGIEPTEHGRYLRDLLHGCEFLQNHIRHFYQYTLPDFVRLPQDQPLFETDHKDFRLPQNINEVMVDHYFHSFTMSRAAHEMLAVLGGKAPHNHGVFIGGISTRPTADTLIKMKSILYQIKNFTLDCMIPDVYLLAHYYPEYYRLGKGYGNLLSYGCFDAYAKLDTLYVKPSLYNQNGFSSFDSLKITEVLDYSWYGNEGNASSQCEPPREDVNKEKAYTWVKAARYEGLPYEVGPLARMWLSGLYKNGISMMDRTVARVLEVRKVAEVMETLLSQIMPDASYQKAYEIPESARGQGLVDTTRGALGHWLEVNHQVISCYQIITPSGWNLSPRDDHALGTAEYALMGTPIDNADNPVELGRIIRSFDPCVSCATHVLRPGRDDKIRLVMP